MSFTPDPGGSAALYGFLYQLCQHLKWVADARFHRLGEGDDAGMVVFEPRSGGDAQRHGVEYVVEQYKTRNGPWSFNEILRDVLPDLRRAVKDAATEKAAYRFITNGWAGHGVEEFLEFTQRVCTLSGPDELDRETIRRYFRRNLSDDELFSQVCSETRPSGYSGGETRERAEVFHLLSHLGVRWQEDLNRVVAKVNEALEQMFPLDRDVDRARASLIGALIERMSGRELRMTHDEIAEFFLRAGLDADLPERLATLPERLAHDIEARLATERNYDRGQDVRGSVAWSPEKPVLVITGESGNGKSWRLARLAADLAAQRGLVTWFAAERSVDETVAQVVDSLWTRALKQTEPRRLAAIEAYCRRWVSPDNAYWLTVVVDEIFDADMAREFVALPEWRVSGARLAFSATRRVADQLELQFPGKVQVLDTTEFTGDELTQFFEKRGRSWSTLPDDLQQLLKKPILASLFAALPYASYASAPKSEYELFSAYWEQMRRKAHEGDVAVLIGIGERVLQKRSYPIARGDWAECLLDPAIVRRLGDLGWLRVDRSERVAFSHDRLMNWAAAEAVYVKVETGAIDEAALASLLRTSMHGEQPFSRPVRYLTMDVLWLLASRPPKGFDADTVLEAIEREDSHFAGTLYEDLLPTLGELAARWLLGRLKATIAFGDARSIYLREGLKALAAQEQFDARPAVYELLDSMVEELQRIAMDIIQVAPQGEYLGALWGMREWHSRKGPDRHLVVTAWCNAVRACVSKDPHWLVHRIRSADTVAENISDLTYVLAGLELEEAPALWLQVRDDLVARTPVGRARGVLYCIRRFGDKSLAPYCESFLLNKSDFLDSAALPALARIAPERALARFSEVDAHTRDFARHAWLPELLERNREDLRSRVDRLVEEGAIGFNELGMLFESRPDDVGSDLLRRYLKMFEPWIDEVGIDPLPDREPFSRPLDLLAGVVDREQLQTLRSLRGGSLEGKIADVAIRRVGKAPGVVDHVLESARAVLLRIAGPGIERLIRAELGSDRYWGRHSGLYWAEVADLGVADQLLRISLGAVPHEDKSGDAKAERYTALRKLAAIEADEQLVEAIWKCGISDIPRDLASIRDATTMSHPILRRAEQVLEDLNAEQEVLQRAIAVAWLSGDAGLLPKVRARLGELVPGSLTAAIAAHLLLRLEDRSDEALQFAKRMLIAQESRWLGVNLLLSFGERGASPLRSHLQSRDPKRPDHLDEAIVEALHRDPVNADVVEKFALRDLDPRGLTPTFYDIAARSGVAGAKDSIRLASFSKDRTFVGRRVRAFRALAIFDLDGALEAARQEFASEPKTADAVCRAVVEMAGPERALRWLINAATGCKDDRCRAIGRAMRGLDFEMVFPTLQALGRSPVMNDRRVAVHCAGWLREPTESWVRSAFEHDAEGRVREEAIVALRRQRRLANAHRLLTELPSLDSRERWGVLQALVASVPRQLLTARQDVLWLGHALDQMPHRYEVFAQDLLDRDRDAKETD